MGRIDNRDIDSLKHLNQSGLHLNSFENAKLTSNFLLSLDVIDGTTTAIAYLYPMMVTTTTTIEIRI